MLILKLTYRFNVRVRWHWLCARCRVPIGHLLPGWDKFEGFQSAVWIHGHHLLINIRRTCRSMGVLHLLEGLGQTRRFLLGFLFFEACNGKYLDIDVNIYDIMITCTMGSYFLHYFYGEFMFVNTLEAIKTIGYVVMDDKISIMVKST
jgi:hypothetical protein